LSGPAALPPSVTRRPLPVDGMRLIGPADLIYDAAISGWKPLGFYESGRDRLVMPGFVPSENTFFEATVETNGTGSGGGTGSGNGGGVDLHLDPLLIALLKKIPSSEKDWPAQTRLRWFRTFAMNVSQIYDAAEDEPVEMKIDLEKKEAANWGGPKSNPHSSNIEPEVCPSRCNSAPHAARSRNALNAGFSVRLTAGNEVEFFNLQFTSFVIRIGHVSPLFVWEGSFPLMPGRRGDTESRSKTFIGCVTQITFQLGH
jgi:hypothetical protein